ncbi:hypothetical protein [Candidatus Clavichlamydia salmonicola]|uniref:hypothetical protein n=1 Tax=Candidatus Clavichlamydia salmonicola TaxID=469812 RepID=UPI001890CB7B|nr:hypothetical protein [Candidatus Clavichlamydia salmonicola]
MDKDSGLKILPHETFIEIEKIETYINHSVGDLVNYIRLIEEKENLLTTALAEILDLKKGLALLRKENIQYKEENAYLAANQVFRKSLKSPIQISMEDSTLESSSLIDHKEEHLLDASWDTTEDHDLLVTDTAHSHLVKKIREAAILRDVAGKQKNLIIKLRNTLREMELALGENDLSSTEDKKIEESSLSKIKRLLIQLGEEEMRDAGINAKVENISC